MTIVGSAVGAAPALPTAPAESANTTRTRQTREVNLAAAEIELASINIIVLEGVENEKGEPRSAFMLSAPTGRRELTRCGGDGP